MKYSESLKKNQDFQHTYKNGTSHANRLLVMYVLKNQYTKNRLGISVSKKVGNAVTRNKIKRQIKNIIDKNQNLFKKNQDYIIIVKKAILDLKYNEIEESIKKLITINKWR